MPKTHNLKEMLQLENEFNENVSNLPFPLAKHLDSFKTTIDPVAGAKKISDFFKLCVQMFFLFELSAFHRFEYPLPKSVRQNLRKKILKGKDLTEGERLSAIYDMNLTLLQEHKAENLLKKLAEIFPIQEKDSLNALLEFKIGDSHKYLDDENITSEIGKISIHFKWLLKKLDFFKSIKMVYNKGFERQIIHSATSFEVNRLESPMDGLFLINRENNENDLLQIEPFIQFRTLPPDQSKNTQDPRLFFFSGISDGSAEIIVIGSDLKEEDAKLLPILTNMIGSEMNSRLENFVENPKTKEKFDAYFDQITREKKAKPLIVIGEEGTGKSLAIESHLNLIQEKTRLIRLSGSTFKCESDQTIIINILAQLFDENPCFDGKVINVLREFCEKHQILYHRNLCEWLEKGFHYCLSESVTSMASNRYNPDFFLQMVSPSPEKSEKIVRDFKGSSFNPYYDLWRIIKAKVIISGQLTILWLEDAQEFAQDSQINCEFIHYLDGKTPNLILIAEFRAQRKNDLNRLRQKFGKEELIEVEEFTKEEIRTWISGKLDIDRRYVEDDLVIPIYEASGGNQKFTIDWFQYLLENGMIRCSPDKDLVQYCPGSNLICPENLLNLKEETLQGFDLPELAWTILYFMAASEDIIHHVDSLRLIFSPVAANEALDILKEYGILKEVEANDCMVRFEHLTTKTACFRLLEKLDCDETKKLLKKITDGRDKIKAIEEQHCCDATSNNWIKLNHVIGEIAELAKDHNLFAKEKISEIIDSDKPKQLELWGSFLRRGRPLEPQAELIQQLICCKIAELSGEKTESGEKYFQIASRSDVLPFKEPSIYWGSSLRMLLFCCQKTLELAPEKIPQVAELLIKLRNNIFNSKPDSFNFIGITKLLFQSFFSNSFEKDRQKFFFEELINYDKINHFNKLSTIGLNFSFYNNCNKPAKSFEDENFETFFSSIFEEMQIAQESCLTDQKEELLENFTAVPGKLLTFTETSDQ